MTPDDNDQSLPARIGRWVNQLDIDFSSFTLVGWVVALGSLVLGGFAGFLVYRLVDGWGQQQDGRAAGLLFFITMVVVTVSSFQMLRAIARWTGNPVVRDSEE